MEYAHFAAYEKDVDKWGIGESCLDEPGQRIANHLPLF